MNNQKRSLSPVSIVSMVGAMLFAIAAALTILMPVISYKDVSSDRNTTYKFSLLDKEAKDTFEQIDDQIKELEKYTDRVSGKQAEYYKVTLDSLKALRMMIIAATVAFFAVIAAAVFVCLGKALQFSSGGRALAVVFSIIGVCSAVFYLAMTIWLVMDYNKLSDLMKEASGGVVSFDETAGVGAGPILMAAFSIAAFVFCCVGNGASTFRRAVSPSNNGYNPNNTYNGYENGFNTNGFSQPPVQPQQQFNSYNPGGYAQQQNQFAPPPQINPQTSPLAGDSTIPLNQINRGTGYSGDSTIPLNQMNRGTGYSGDSTIPLNQMNRGTGMSGEATVPLNQVRSQSGEATVPLGRGHSMSGEGTIPLSQVGTVRANKAPGTLKCIKGDFLSMEVELKPGEKIVIGRDPASCSVIVGADKSDVSRTHCSVWYDPAKNEFKIKDTSSNGTFVNGQKLPKDQHVQIPEGSIISLGNGDNQFKIVRN